MVTVTTAFDVRDRVHIDGDTTIIAAVLSIQIRESQRDLYELSWVHNGEVKTAWLDEWRLTRVDK